MDGKDLNNSLASFDKKRKEEEERRRGKGMPKRRGSSQPARENSGSESEGDGSPTRKLKRSVEQIIHDECVRPARVVVASRARRVRS